MIRTLALCLFASPALADGLACFPRHELIAELDADYSQRNMARGVDADGAIVEVYVSPEGAWTMVVIFPKPGPLEACLVATGTDFMMIAQGVEG